MKKGWRLDKEYMAQRRAREEARLQRVILRMKIEMDKAMKQVQLKFLDAESKHINERNRLWGILSKCPGGLDAARRT